MRGAYHEQGRVTIPAEIRRDLGVRAGDCLIFRSSDGVVTIAPGRKAALACLLAGFDPAKHRRGSQERSSEDAPTGRESI